jgi:polyphosphate kinase
LIPGIPGISANIEAISIVDRFLEHSRVIVFCHGGDNKYYITSADWMIRNFDNRIEVACPVIDKEIQLELKRMLDIQLSDNTTARVIGPGEANQYKQNGEPPVRSQLLIYELLKQKLDNAQIQ